MRHIYEPNKKHKWPKGFGTRCPHMPETLPQRLLDGAVELGDASNKQRWSVHGSWLFRALKHEDLPSENAEKWHGHPVPGADAPEPVLAALVEAKLMTAKQKRRFMQQQQLPVVGEQPGRIEEAP